MKSALLSFIFLFISAFGLAKGVEGGESIFDLWEESQRTNIEFHIDMEALEANRKTTESVAATIIEDGVAYELDVTVRGRFRRRTCAMPPMKLQFRKDVLRAAGLNTHNDFKLVTHCTDDAAGQDALLREQLAYELYNIVNPAASFRTQLLTITYVNTTDGSTTTSYAILIEDSDELQDRMNADNCKECYNAPLATYNNAESVALFQYMIGNADYDTKMIRNLKAMQHADGSLTAVPYDFDYSGLVRPSYLSKDIVQRRMVWEFEDAGNFETAKADFLAKQDILMDHIANFDQLSNQSKKEIGRYVKGFYRKLPSIGLDK